MDCSQLKKKQKLTTDKMYMPFIRFLCYSFFLILAGCAHVISEQIRQEARQDITFLEVFDNPDQYIGEIIIVSGVIIEAKNTPKGTELKVLQQPGGYRGRPKDVDYSEGRFIALDKRLLDVEIYNKGREVTIAGRIQGKKNRLLGEIEYTYPFLLIEELHLWTVTRKHDYYYPYPYPYHYRYHWRSRYFWCY